MIIDVHLEIHVSLFVASLSLVTYPEESSLH